MATEELLERAKPQLRERLEAVGPSGLTDEELLALLLGTGTAQRSAEQLARELLQCHGGLMGVAALPPRLLSRARGIGAARAARLIAGLELGRRHVALIQTPRPVLIKSAEDAAARLSWLVEQRREQLVGLYLDTLGRLVGEETLAVGSLNVARAMPRDLLEPALRWHAAGFLLVHNHPSGDPEPSEDDLRFTRTVGRAAALMGVTLFDHVVVAKEGLVSLRGRGLVWEGM